MQRRATVLVRRVERFGHVGGLEPWKELGGFECEESRVCENSGKNMEIGKIEKNRDCVFSLFECVISSL